MRRDLHPLPSQDPISGSELYISELTAEQSGVVIRGKFEIPRYAKLKPDHAQFLEVFLRCRGILSSVEKELGLSYPTVRARLDAMLQALDLPPMKTESRQERTTYSNGVANDILSQLEAGSITPEEAKVKLQQIGQGAGE